MKKKNKGFTLIELISVLVILAILALIVTPLVLNIIRKARVSADKRSIDAYGRSIELAVASYLLDNGTFPTSVEQLTIEYSGDRVECQTTKLNSDSSVYLASCTVAGRTVENYTYGKEETVTYDAYEVGDEVTYNNVNYRVIKDSNASDSSVTLLKAEPIKSTEISSYLTSTEVASKVNTSGTYAKMAYYSSENCVSAGDISGCSTDYSVSDVKQVVDVWKVNYANGATEARLITYDELIDNLGYDKATWDGSFWNVNKDYTPSWVYAPNYWYWTMSLYEGSSSAVWHVNTGGNLSSNSVNAAGGAVRPVITLSKTNISS